MSNTFIPLSWAVYPIGLLILVIFVLLVLLFRSSFCQKIAIDALVSAEDLNKLQREALDHARVRITKLVGELARFKPDGNQIVKDALDNRKL